MEKLHVCPAEESQPGHSGRCLSGPDEEEGFAEAGGRQGPASTDFLFDHIRDKPMTLTSWMPHPSRVTGPGDLGCLRLGRERPTASDSKVQGHDPCPWRADRESQMHGQEGVFKSLPSFGPIGSSQSGEEISLWPQEHQMGSGDSRSHGRQRRELCRRKQSGKAFWRRLPTGGDSG